MTGHAVVIAGGGPTGLMLAAELALGGADVAIVERRANQDLTGSRSGGLHSRTIEILDQRGIAGRFISQGQVHPTLGFHTIRLDITDLPTRHNYLLALWQNHIERTLAQWVDELGVPIYRRCDVMGLAQDATGVDVALSSGQSIRAEYLVGCDGGHSTVRKAAGIEFRGWDPTTSWLIAEVEMAEEPTWGFHEDAIGIHAIARGENGAAARVVLTEDRLRLTSDPSLTDVREALINIYGADYGIHSPVWISRFTDVTRQAVTYRNERVLLAGDSAHVHPPMGGQGLNIGVQDAVNLGWKLAQVVRGVSPESLLDTYHAERYPVAARVLRNAMAQVSLRRRDARTKALGDTVAELLGMDEPRRRLAAELSGLGIHYDLGGNHPLVGNRMPDLQMVTDNGAVQAFTLLHDARPVLINFGEPGRLHVGPWSDRVRVIDAEYGGEWVLPAFGVVTSPVAALVRPDGYVAWVGDQVQRGLEKALTTWFGPDRPATCTAAMKKNSITCERK